MVGRGCLVNGIGEGPYLYSDGDSGRLAEKLHGSIWYASWLGWGTQGNTVSVGDGGPWHTAIHMTLPLTVLHGRPLLSSLLSHHAPRLPHSPDVAAHAVALVAGPMRRTSSMACCKIFGKNTNDGVRRPWVCVWNFDGGSVGPRRRRFSTMVNVSADPRQCRRIRPHPIKGRAVTFNGCSLRTKHFRS